jgi:hypothetical protein
MASRTLPFTKLSPEQVICRDAYVKYVELGFDFGLLAGKLGVDPASAEFLVRSHQRWMADNSTDNTAGAKFDEILAEFTSSE